MLKERALFLRYGAAILSVAAATLIRFILTPALGEAVPFIFYFPAVVISAWYGGVGPGLFSTAFSAALAWYLFVPSHHAITFTEWSAPARLIAFFLGCALTSVVAESLRRAHGLASESAKGEHEERERLRVTLASIGDAVIATDDQGRVTFLNSVAEALTGWAHAEALGKDLKDVFRIINEHTRKEVGSPLARVLREGAVVGLANHTLLISRDGVERPIADSGAPIKNDAGKILGAVLVFRDVTADRKAEAAALRLASIVESSDDAIISKTPEGIITSWNRAAERIFGYAAAEAVGRSIHLIIPSELHAEEDQILERLQRGEHVDHYETVRLAKSGARVEVSLSISPVRNGEGQIIGVSKIARDITAQKRQERAMRESERFNRSIVESSRDCIKLLDLEGGLLSINRRGMEALGISDFQPYLHQPWVEFWPEEDRPAARAALRAAVECGVGNFTGYFAAADGRPKWWDVVITPIPGADGKPERLLAVSRDITQIKRAEQELRAAEDRLRLALESARTVVWDWDLHSDQVTCSENAPGIWGIEVGNAEDFIRAIHPEDRAAVRQAHDEAVRGDGPYTSEYRVIKPGGQTCWMQSLGKVYFESDGRACRIVGISSDITERRRMEDELRKSESRLTAALQIAQLGVWEYDPDTSFTRWDKRCREIFGIPGDRPVSYEEVFALIHPEDRPRVEGRVRAALDPRGSGLYEAEYRIVRPDGAIRWVAVRGHAISSGNDEGRDGARFVGTLMDITELRRTERELRESEAHFRGLADAMPQLVWTAGADGAVEYYNSRASEYGGIIARADGTWDWQPVVHEDDLRMTLEAWRSAVRNGAVYECEHRIRLADGSFRWHLSRAKPLKDADGRVIKWFGTATDIHDLRESQQTLQENDRRKDEFLAMLAHELRNPLAPIRNAARVLGHVAPATPQVEQMREIIERQTEQLTRLVDDLLDVSRITRGKITLQRERLELMSVISRAVETCRPLLDAARHQLTVSLPAESVRVEGDLARLSQVVANILSNAAKYTEEGGHIELSAARQGDEVLIRVRDDGVGIPAGALPHIFDLFAQADRSLDRAQGGLGIGLTVVKSLVEMHGGRVEAHSDGPGKGSEFTVRLPVFVEPPQESNAAQDGAAEGGGTALPAHCRKILVVDDNVDSAQSMALLLKFEGHEVRMAHDGPETLRIAREFRPQIVLLDIGLPGMNGYEVARKLREDPPVENALLIALTGYGQEEDRRRSREAGFDHHLTKPVDYDALNALIGSLTFD